MKLDELDDWMTVRALWRLASEAEARKLAPKPAEDRRDASLVERRRPRMTGLINKPDAGVIARDLSIALIIAGLVLLFF